MITSYRQSVTGMWRYSFYDGQTPAGEACSDISLTPTVRITGDGIDWYSQFGLDRQVVPGVSRRVKDNRTGEEVYRIIYWQPGMYEFTAKTPKGIWTMLMEERNGMYLFGQQGMPVLAITEQIKEAERTPPNMEPAFQTKIFDPVSEGLRLMVLSFPALKFAG